MKFLDYISEAREMLKDWQSYVSKNPELAAGVKVLQKINKAGYKAYIVGGPVRDITLGIQPKDIDIATNMPMKELDKMFRTYDIGKSKDFGILVVKEGGNDFEVAQFRTDGKYIDGRRPESVKIQGSFEDDAGRRDFTINAMGVNAKGEIIDYFDGKRDIKNKVLRTVGDPLKRFGEDYLRMMRLARFSSRLGFEIDPETKKAAKKLSPNILSLAPERVKDELMKSAAQSGEKFAQYIQILGDLKILRIILPEVMNLKWFRENLQHHPETRGEGGTVYSHVMAALKQSKTADPIKNLAILLHDVGKGVTFAPKPGAGTPTYYRHARKSVRLVNAIADRLKMSNKERDALIFGVGNHMKFHQILDMKPSKIAKLVSDENWEVLVAVGKADEFSRGKTFMHSGEFEKIVDKAIKIKEKYGTKEVVKRIKLVDGNHVMKITGLPQGKKVGDIIRKTTEWIMDNVVKDKEVIDNYIMSLA
jgi:tRNA nucleotidyltransferase (CCA-adding enzyme)